MPPLVEVLTARELEVVRLVAQGMKNKEIGAVLHLSAKTIPQYLNRVYDKLALTGGEGSRRLKLARLAFEWGLVDFQKS